jgi:inner membrane transporter RhtA
VATEPAASDVARAHRTQTRLAAALVVGSITSVQCGAALATTLFDEVGSSGAVLLRSGFGALVLLALAGRGLPPVRQWLERDVLLFALALAGATLCFYAAIERLPLGIAVTFEFLGPLGVAVFGSRRRRDLIWVALAAIGIVLLSNSGGGGGLDALGVVLALIAAGFWALYILQSARVGEIHPGMGGLAAAATVSTVMVAPFGVADGGVDLLAPAVLAVGLGVGLLSAAIPYALEFEALRRLPSAVFGVLMSLEPAAGAIVGFVALSQGLGLVEVIAIGLVVTASAGALRSAGTPVPRDG